MKSSGHHKALSIALLALIVSTTFRLIKTSNSDDQRPRSSSNSAPTSVRSHALSINRATQDQLEALPGIGPALARRIIEARARTGPFRSLADLDRIRGVGPVLLARLSSLVRFDLDVEGPTRPDADADHVRQPSLEEAR